MKIKNAANSSEAGTATRVPASTTLPLTTNGIRQLKHLRFTPLSLGTNAARLKPFDKRKTPNCFGVFPRESEVG